MKRFLISLIATLTIIGMTIPAMAATFYETDVDHDKVGAMGITSVFCSGIRANPQEPHPDFFLLIDAIEKGDIEGAEFLATDEDTKCIKASAFGLPPLEIITGKRIGHFMHPNGECMQLLRLFARNGLPVYSWFTSEDACGLPS